MTEQPIPIDEQTKRAVRVFLDRIASRYSLSGAFLFGSRARGAYDKYSDADVAVLLNGPRGDALDTGVAMAGIAFDVLLDTEILVSPLPLWDEDWSPGNLFKSAPPAEYPPGGNCAVKAADFATSH